MSSLFDTRPKLPPHPVVDWGQADARKIVDRFCTIGAPNGVHSRAFRRWIEQKGRRVRAHERI